MSTNRLNSVRQQRMRRENRIRSQIRGTSERPRLHVHISNKHISAQIIDDSTMKTLAATTTVGRKMEKKTMTEKAQWIGSDIAKKAIGKKTSKVVLDRGGKQYHGRLKVLADTAREAGLEF